MSNFNTLYHGEPAIVANVLGDGATADELRLALINALNRIAVLEEAVADLTAASALRPAGCAT